MSNGDNFAGGFVAGALLGGVLGGLLGAALVSRSGQTSEKESLEGSVPKATSGGTSNRRRRWISTARAGSEERIEEARTGLEDKIAQLNAAIDEARQQLSETEPLNKPSPNEKALNEKALKETEQNHPPRQNGGQTLGSTPNHQAL